MPYFEDGSSGPVLSITNSMSSILPLIVSGVGQGNDLSVLLKKSPTGRWFPMIHKGWYYKGAEERYLFADMQRRQILLEARTTTGISVTGTPTLNEVVEYGPVFLTSPSINYKYVHNPLRTMRQLSWTNITSTNLWQAALSGAIVMSILDTYSEPLERVPSSGLVTQNDLYYHNPVTGELIVAASSSPSALCISYTTSCSGSDALLIEEIHQVDYDYKVRTSYSGIYANNTYPTYLPIVSKQATSGLVTFTASASSVETSSNRIAVPSGTFSEGDIVSIKYYVENSFAIVGSSVYAFSTSAATANLDFEGSESNYQDTSALLETDNSYIQLNQMYSGVGHGFIYLAERVEPTVAAYSINLAYAPTRVEVVSAKGPQVRLVTKVSDKDGNPIQGIYVSLTQTGSYGYVESTSPTGSITNWLGEVCHTWRPSAVGTQVFSVSASGTTLQSADVSIEQVGLLDITYPTMTSGALPKLYVILDDTTISNNVATIRAALKQRDGSPYPREGIALKFSCNTGAFVGSDSQGNYIIKTTDVLGYASVSYKISTGDKIVVSTELTTAMGGSGYIFSDEMVVNN